VMLTQPLSGFEWDDGNRHKCRKHGVSLAAIESAFQGEIAVFPDLKHSQDEERFFAIGKTSEGRGVFVAFTFRHRDGETYIRPISARYMHQKEVAHYEKTLADTKDR